MTLGIGDARPDSVHRARLRELPPGEASPSRWAWTAGRAISIGTTRCSVPSQHSRDLTTGVFRAGAAPSDVYRIIAGGPNIGPMPNYQNLPEADRWALVHYVRSTFKSDYPQAPASADAQAKAPRRPSP